MLAIVSWFDAHAGAVQAVTAIVTALLAAVVARLTWRYVILTGVLTESARRQVEIAQLNASASAALQQTAERQLEVAVLTQREEERQRREAVEGNSKLLDGLCARLLAHFAAASAEAPNEVFFRNAPPIEDTDIAKLRETAVRVPSAEPYDIEALLAALNVLRDLQGKTRAVAAGMGYFYSDTEQRMYVSNLAILRERLARYTSYRPPAQI